eukprot:TRINITY_DN4196_c0_g3_i2.p1 TRINITY_DN4196_c0_g3~~TRINITY_DN4196_c0_g3_i2.p1  ORF type:complete len:539 (+),score=91.42 TRINITY_DN4196_c0_g3_i2:190-1806(+)
MLNLARSRALLRSRTLGATLWHQSWVLPCARSSALVRSSSQSTTRRMYSYNVTFAPVSWPCTSRRGSRRTISTSQRTCGVVGIPIPLPALSPTMTEGTVVKWVVAEGEAVSAGDVLFEMETDKATMSVESPEDGILAKIIVPAGAKVPVSQLVALMVEEGEDYTQVVVPDPVPVSVQTPEVPAAASAAPSEASFTSAADGAAPVDLSSLRIWPAAQRLIAENRISGAKLSALAMSATGPTSSKVLSITKQDVLRFIGEIPPLPFHAAAGSSPVSVAAATPSPSTPPPPRPPPPPPSTPAMPLQSSSASYTDIANTGMRKVIAQRLSESKREVPHTYMTTTCKMDTLLKLRGKLNKDLAESPRGGKLSVNDFIVRALALTLQDVPDANVSWMDAVTRRYLSSDISVAVATDGGLITPIVKDAHLKSLTQIASSVRDLATRARAGKLAPNEYQGGTATVSNLGMFGITEFSAVINPPQACILAIGGAKERAVINANGEPDVETTMNVTLSVDERAVEAASAARMMDRFKELLEEPVKMLL